MALNLMALNDNKAGMGELDKERINAIILENSKGSKFFENQQRKTQQLQKRIEEKLAQREKITPAMIKKGEAEADVIIHQIEAGRVLSRHILHIDMDAFYAAVEMRDQPALRSKPMAVGGMSMLSTSNYVARRFGVRAAMPGFIAKKLCPELCIVPCNFAKYTAASQEVRAILALYDPDFAPMSLDEAYLDLTEHLRARAGSSEEERTFGNRHECNCGKLSEEEKRNVLSEDRESACRQCMAALDGKPRTFGLSFWEAARELRWRVFDATQLTASAGLAPNCLLAKVASDRRKPNGQFEIGASEDDIALFVRSLPVRKVPGIGNVSEQMLKALGITACSDIYEQRGLLFHLSTPCNFRYYLRVSMGDGDTVVSNDGERKSMSVERTFPELKKAAELLEKCRELSDALAEDLRDARMKGRTVTLKAKLVTFEVRTRAQTLPQATRDPEQVAAAAAELLRNEINAAFPEPLRLRLMGVRMSGLVSDDMVVESGQQLSLEKAFKASRGRQDGSDKLLTAGEKEDEQKASNGELKQKSSNFFEKFQKEGADNPREDKKTNISSNGREQKASNSKPKEKSLSFFEKFQKDETRSSPEDKKSDICSSDFEQKALKTKQTPTGFFKKYEKGKSCNSDDKEHNEKVKEKVSISKESQKEDVTTLQPQNTAKEAPVIAQAPPPLNRKKERVQRPASPVFNGACAADAAPAAPAPVSAPSAPQPGDPWSGFTCPVCGRMQLVQSERQFHAHLDFCLSRSAITEAIKEADEELPAPKRSKQTPIEKSGKNAPLLKYFSKSNS